MASKVTGVRMARGQKLRLETPGGGGWGAASTRPPDSVAADVRSGFVSLTAAREDYRVVMTSGGQVDAAATATLRREMTR